ncbi:MAG: DUF2306 domain-containing protein [Flammeovirgaceae bacterium]|nr:DUF2306 domain-containing protein [Flammeovirgaceae bacterium]
MNKFGWIVFAFFAIGVGLYPIAYLLTDAKIGILNSKTDELLNDAVWNWAFYQHILFGGMALLTGWSQFSKKIRAKNLNFHRTLGKFYVTVCLISGIAGLYLAFHATGGIVAKLGFGGLAVSWLVSTFIAFRAIRARRIDDHQAWMIRSYALTFAAVTLRIWLPMSQIAGIEFIEAYRVIAWLCWVPNLIFAEWLINRLKLPSLVLTK